jgi:iron complex outermembrane receptor protein
VVVQGVGRGKVGEPLSLVQLDAARISTQVNAVTVEDTLKYLPNIFVRRRHVGDTQAPITTRTSGVGSSARSLIYADGVLLSALIANNNTIGSPRWGMVAPEEIDRVEARFGPFSAAYPGNAMGSVIEIATRLPKAFEATARGLVSTGGFSQYGTKRSLQTYQAGAALGDRRGPLAFRLSWNHTDSESQPISYGTIARPSGTSAAGTPVTGGFPDVNRTNQPILVVGAGGIENQKQDNGKLKLAVDLSSTLQATVLVGYFGHTNESRVETYLRDAAGAPVYAGSINFEGRNYTIANATLSNGRYELEERHWMEAFTLKGTPSDRLSWAVVATDYAYAKDVQRLPTVSLAQAEAGGAGAIVDLKGTGWETLDASLIWRPAGLEGTHQLRVGAHWDRYELRNRRFNTDDWIRGRRGALAAQSSGRTDAKALWAEDLVRLSDTLDLTVGARFERWKASRGLNYSLAPALSTTQPELDADKLSPKAVLKWSPNEAWRATASAGIAYRFPTVAELYQAVTTGNTLTVPNPFLNPERAVSTEVSLERRFGMGAVRVSAFTEDVRDALISQSTPLPPGSSQSFSFVQNVPKVRSRGVELVVDLRDVGVRGLDLQASATYVDARTVKDPALPAAEGKRVPQVARFRWTAVATYRASERLSLTLAGRYSDRVFATIENSDSVGHTYQGFEGYFIVDARASYRLTGNWTAAVGVDNLNNRDYFLFHPFPRRTWTAELKYSY